MALPVASNGTENWTENVPLEATVLDLDPVTAPLSVTAIDLFGVKPWPLTVIVVDAAMLEGGAVSTGDSAGQGLIVGVGEGGGGGGLVGVGLGFGTEVGGEVGRGV